MKKIALSAFALFSIATMSTSFAQQGFSVSVLGAPQLTWMNNKTDKDNSSYGSKTKFAASFGLGTQYNFTNHAGIALDVLYSLQGRKYDFAGVEYNQKNEYVKIPLLFAYTASISKGVSIVGQAGPQLSLLTSANTELGSVKTDNKDQYKDITFGGAANAGLQFALAKNIFLNTGVRFDYDFTNAENKNYESYPAGRAKTYNSALGLEVGLKYQFN